MAKEKVLTGPHLSARIEEIPSSRSKGKGKGQTRIERGPNPRKRKMLPEEESSDDEPFPRLEHNRGISFYVREEDKVISFLYTRFMQIQQLAGKLIAKAWIRAICPKKQANYPYVDSNPRPDQPRRKTRHDGPPRIPSFWPDTDRCRHKEPDHTDKYGRHVMVMVDAQS